MNQVVEFMSCGEVRWKPWMDEGLLRGRAGNRLCRYDARDDGLWWAHRQWGEVRRRAEGRVAAAAVS